MTGPILLGIVVLVVIIGILLYACIQEIQAYCTGRGKWLVKCPETQQAAAVGVAARNAAAIAFGRRPTLWLDQCSRWPQRQNCGQECLQQIESDPDNCLVWNIVSRWYEGQSCVLCHKRFARLKHLDHSPALMDADRKTTEWKYFRPEELPKLFSTYWPVCWDCHVTETFRRIHPELVISRDRGAHRHV